MVMVACGDAFTVAIGAGEGAQGKGGQGRMCWVMFSSFPLEMFFTVQCFAACLDCAPLF